MSTDYDASTDYTISSVSSLDHSPWMAASQSDDRSQSQLSFVMVEHGDVPFQDQIDFLDDISQCIDNLSSSLREISLDIHSHPELQFKEHRAHDLLVKFLRQQKGWSVTPAAYGIDTAFVAVYNSGRKGPVVSFNAEYDALVGIGHACGHNLIAITSLAAALATARLVEKRDLPGKVVLFGTPAEEGGGGKIKLIKAGAYADNGVDISLITHPGIDPNHALVRTAAYSAFKVEYFGKEAHAAAKPWQGINALDALVIAYTAISVLRQQTETGDIIQCQITNGGARPNIIHAYSSGRFVVRSTTRPRVEALSRRVEACFEAGAAATGAQLKLTPGMSYAAHVPNRALGRSYRHFFNRLAGDGPELGGPIAIPELDWIAGETQASTDQGDISYAMPSLSPNVWIRSEDETGKQLGGPHTPDFANAARTEEAHTMALRAAKALAATAIDVFTRSELLREAKSEFEKMKDE